jgi:hypothetical protein
MSWYAMVCDVMCCRYVSPLVVATAMLLGPMLATAEGVVASVEAVPGPWTMLGFLPMVAGGWLIAVQAWTRSVTVEVGGHWQSSGRSGRTSSGPSPRPRGRA